VPGRAAVSAAGHADILRAMQARDADGAEMLMREHIDDARHALLRQMDEIEQHQEADPS
jgi:DNA-binding GntR family transcriptional regulator